MAKSAWLQTRSSCNDLRPTPKLGSTSAADVTSPRHATSDDTRNVTGHVTDYGTSHVADHTSRFANDFVTGHADDAGRVSNLATWKTRQLSYSSPKRSSVESIIRQPRAMEEEWGILESASFVYIV